MQNEERARFVASILFCILHSAFCILNSLFLLPAAIPTVDHQIEPSCEVTGSAGEVDQAAL